MALEPHFLEYTEFSRSNVASQGCDAYLRFGASSLAREERKARADVTFAVSAEADVRVKKAEWESSLR